MEIFGGNLPAAVQYLLAFVIILALLAGLAAILRRMTGSRSRIGFSATSARHRQQRLGIVDAVDIDANRQLLLLRRDNVEHLVMVGGPNDLLVESGIGRQSYRPASPLPPQQQPLPHSTEALVADQLVIPDLEPAPKPAVSPVGTMPEAHVRSDKTTEREKPVVQPAREPVPAQTAPIIPEPMMTRGPSGMRSMATPAAPNLSAMRSIPAAAIPPVPPTVPVRPTLEKDIASKITGAQSSMSMIRQDEEPHSPSARMQMTSAMSSATAENMAPQTVTIKPNAPSDAPVAAASGEQNPAQRPISGMSRQLEEALKRQFSAVRPSPVTGIKLDEPSVASAINAQELEKRGTENVPSFVAPIVPPRQEQEPAPQSAPAEKAATPAIPASERAKTPAFDLSSLEDIESEFARLLGRIPPSKDK